jgi:hypothetical protein
MKSFVCRRCGSPVPLRRFLNATTKPFCARCGWNLDRAEAALDEQPGDDEAHPLGNRRSRRFLCLDGGKNPTIL